MVETGNPLPLRLGSSRDSGQLNFGCRALVSIGCHRQCRVRAGSMSLERGCRSFFPEARSSRREFQRRPVLVSIRVWSAAGTRRHAGCGGAWGYWERCPVRPCRCAFAGSRAPRRARSTSRSGRGALGSGQRDRPLTRAIVGRYCGTHCDRTRLVRHRHGGGEPRGGLGHG
jgi:hypothetical protein